MYNVQCTMYNVQCTMYNVKCTLIVQCRMYNVHLNVHVSTLFDETKMHILLNLNLEWSLIGVKWQLQIQDKRWKISEKKCRNSTLVIPSHPYTEYYFHPLHCHPRYIRIRELEIISTYFKVVENLDKGIESLPQTQISTWLYDTYTIWSKRLSSFRIPKVYTVRQVAKIKGL